MKSASQIALSKAWWRKEAPPGLKKSAAAFEKALEELAKAEAALGNGASDQGAKAFEAALSSMQAAGKQVAAEAKDLEKKEKDKKAKAELANTQAVMDKPLAKEIAAARAKLAQLGDGKGSDFGDAAAHARFVKSWAPRIKRGQVSFAVGMPSAKPEEMRLNFHMTKDGRGLASVLKREAGAKKVAFGRAGALALAEEAGEAGEADTNARTLCLDIEGGRIPGLAKRVRLLLKALGVSQFGKVLVLEGGVEVDAADEDLPDDLALAAVDLEDAAEPGPEDDAPPTPADPAEPTYKARKAAALPEILALLKSDRPDLGPLKAMAAAMAAAERATDWARALATLDRLLASAHGAPPVTPEENARLAALSPEALAATDLTRGETEDLFSEEYMRRLKDAPIKGVGNPTLKELMREVEAGVSGPRRAEVMTGLAGIVGIPPTAERLDTDYGRFLVVRKQQMAIGGAKDAEADTLDEAMHPAFLASRGQLMFGKVLGDAFGIHEVFAALLSPTGGLVGPGNWLIPGVVKAGHLAPDNPVALHGTVHDAAGYLLTFHGEGPGYNYRDSKIEILGTESPLSGQVSGIAYWVTEAGDEYLVRRVDAAVAKVEKKLAAVRSAVTGKIDAMIAKARGAATEVARSARRAGDKVEAGAVEVVEAIHDARETVERAAVEALDTARDHVAHSMRAAAKRKFEAAWAFIRS